MRRGDQMGYLMGIDAGTSSAKALVMDHRGNVLAFESSSYDISIPAPEYAEQDAQLLWKHVSIAVKRALSVVRSGEIDAIGVTGQMHGLVCLDASLAPVRPIIIWADQRSRRQVDFLRNTSIEKCACNPAFTGMALPSLLWIRDNEKENYKKIRHILQPKDYIVYKLTGNIATEFSDASGTLMMNASTCTWNEDDLEKLDLDCSILPPIRKSSEVAGQLSQLAAKELGLPAGLPVVHGGGDTLMQLAGNGVVRPGQIAVNIGTASQISCVIPSAPESYGNLNSFHHILDADIWVSCGASLNGGILLKWCREFFFDNKIHYGDIDAMAQTSSPGAGGIVVLPFICGERSPYLDDGAKGIIFGLTLSNHPSDFFRAMLESVVYSFRDCLRFFPPQAVSDAQYVIASGGGAKSRLWLQIQADILKKPVRFNTAAVEAAKGAAICAGAGTGIYNSIEEGCDIVVRLSDEVIEPDPSSYEVYDERFATYLELYRKNKDLFL